MKMGFNHKAHVSNIIASLLIVSLQGVAHKIVGVHVGELRERQRKRERQRCQCLSGG